MKSINYAAAAVSGIATCGFTMNYCHPELKKLAIDIIDLKPTKPQRLSYDEYWNNSKITDNTCAMQIVDRIFSYPSYGLDQLCSYD